MDEFDKKQELEKPENDLFRRENIYLLVSTAFLGILFDILFYKKALGVSYPLFVIALYSILFLNMGDKPEIKFEFRWILGIPVLALSFTYLIYSNMVFKVLNFLAIPVLMIAHAILLTSNNRYRWYESGILRDLLYGMIVRPLSNIVMPISIITRLFKRKAVPSRYSSLGKALLGLVISAPLVFVIISLLSSADEVFNRLIEHIPNLFDRLRVNDFVGRILLIIMVTCILYSFIWSLLNQKLKDRANGAAALFPSAGFIDPVTIITILVMVNLIYTVFTFIQFTYLFGSLSIGLPENFTYAQYARRGFFELVMVTVINLAILLGNINFIKKGSMGALKTVKILNSILVACTLVMLISAHFRMSLYEEAYGYTYLRVLTHLFMLYLFILLTATLYKVWKEKLYLLKAYIVISLIAYTMINYVNIDSIIVKNNIERYKAGNGIDVAYLASLSDDIVPDLTNLLKDGLDKEATGQLKKLLYEKKERLDNEKGWQSFNIAEYRAWKKLKELDNMD